MATAITIGILLLLLGVTGALMLRAVRHAARAEAFEQNIKETHKTLVDTYAQNAKDIATPDKHDPRSNIQL